MVSRSKFDIDTATVAALLGDAGITGAQNIQPLGAGEYNAVFSAEAGGKAYVVKISPAEGVAVMTHEKDLMAAELAWYDTLAKHTDIRTPRIYYRDFSRSRIPADYFIMERLPGAQLDKAGLTNEEKAAAQTAKVQMAAQMHAIPGPGFGYVQNGLAENWYLAVRTMLQNVVDDAKSMGKRTKRGERLLAYVDEYCDVLAEAECGMVSFELWDPNILVTRGEGGGLEYAWIDPERSFWGDRLADFVCFETMKPLDEMDKSITAYNAVAKTPVGKSRGECVRQAVMLGYLGTVMEVERYYRYTRRHFGWYRNALACAMLYSRAFKVLQGG